MRSKIVGPKLRVELSGLEVHALVDALDVWIAEAVDSKRRSAVVLSLREKLQERATEMDEKRAVEMKLRKLRMTG